jgi:hypothetical protein
MKDTYAICAEKTQQPCLETHMQLYRFGLAMNITYVPDAQLALDGL